MSIRKAELLRNIYHDRYHFPAWSIAPKNFSNLRFKESVIYCNRHDDLEEVRAVAFQREPVNMEMKRYYSQSELKKQFGWSTGAYGKISTKDRLAPNIAVYVHTPIRLRNGSFKEVHLINLIGYAFDSPTQPDFKYFTRKGRIDYISLVEAYKKMWFYAFYCAEELGLKYLQVSKVGGGAFAPDPDTYDELIFKPSFDRVRAHFPRINVIMPDSFRVPLSLERMSQEKLDQTLFINAWDCWSMVGNGNARDNSLDGWWGRISAATVLATPLVNREMTLVRLKIPNII